MKPINFTSVHDYLDLLFSEREVNESDIIEAKRNYWRAYNTNLKRRQRKTKSTLHIMFTKKELSQIQDKLTKGQSVVQYIHDLTLHHLQSDESFGKQVNTALIEQQLFLIAEYLNELLTIDGVDTDKITILEQHIKTLETVILDSL